jgi:hypothetical protein
MLDQKDNLYLVLDALPFFLSLKSVQLFSFVTKILKQPIPKLNNSYSLAVVSQLFIALLESKE